MGSEGRDTADELVAEYDTGPAENRAMVPLGGIGAADRSAENFKDNLALAGIARRVDILDPDVARAVKDRSFHRFNTRSAL